MKTIMCALLLLGLMTDISEARRSQQYHSYRFYKNFYEEHKDDKTEKKSKRMAIKALDEEYPAVPFQQYTGSTILDAWSGRKVIEWICGNRNEKAL